MITVREATGRDVPGIRDIFLASYGTEYPDRRCYDEELLTRLVYSDNSLVLVAEETASGRVLGTGSVELEIGAHADLVGEFCRLAVHPAARGQGLGNLLMRERLSRVQNRLQVGIVEARVDQPFSARIALAHQFAPVGFLPMRFSMRGGESLAMLARYFGQTPALRKNHPRVIPEIGPLADLSLHHCSLPVDTIIDEDSPPYPGGTAFAVQDLNTQGYAGLLRIERGRVRHREIFGPGKLHYGIFNLQATNSRYLIARQDDTIAGAVGFTLDPVDQAVRIFELIPRDDDVIRFLLDSLVRVSGEEGGGLIEVDVSAHAPRMQRTLLELGFLPVAYVPALVFHDVERLDVVRMMRLPAAPDVASHNLPDPCRTVAEMVLRRFQARSVLPRVAGAVQSLGLFRGLSAEQIERLAGICTVAVFEAGEMIFRAGQASDRIYVLLTGQVGITSAATENQIASVTSGECLGEVSLLTGGPHSATATASTRVETVVFARRDLEALVRLRPDIGVPIYRNLALGLGAKLCRSS